ncbi:MAG: MlaE family lipid ABC transporter permease subunit [Xanthobacteraceae bacterium]|nr:MlaE family lipid ABC transporter permease subunit [Xanthobacteraceae bacterium]
MNIGPTLEQMPTGAGLALHASGEWTVHHAPVLEKLVNRTARLDRDRTGIVIDVSRISKLDTFGAWLIERLRRNLTQGEASPQIAGLSENYASLVEEVKRVTSDVPPIRQSIGPIRAVEAVGRTVAEIGVTLRDILNMTGALLSAMGHVILHPTRFRLTSTVHQLEQVCWRAVPIVVLITFLIGCIIAQQGIFQFRKFGADVFVVDMLGVLVLREIGVLLVAIMVAGRSGSAYTAELGSMRMREEVDALRTMGFDPTEVLILPRIVALVIAMPILAFLGAMAALYGGGLTAWLYGGVQPDAFLSRLREAISINHFTVGLVKAPFMALIIGIIACVEGAAVQGSAESLGQHTTASVVKSIFFVIVVDGLFAIFFASIGI